MRKDVGVRARAAFMCAPGTRELWNAQPRPVQDALAAAWIRHAMTGEEPKPGELPAGLWEQARGLVERQRKGGKR